MFLSRMFHAMEIAQFLVNNSESNGICKLGMSGMGGTGRPQHWSKWEIREDCKLGCKK